MKAIRARVVNGKFVIDTPAPYPDGTEIDLQIADDGTDDDMDPEESAALDASLAQGWAEAQAGDLISADELLKRLRAEG